jgi:hypothetical protein
MRGPSPLQAWIPDRVRDDVEGFGVGSVGSGIVVFKPHDVVFAQVAARLHFDDLQRDAAGVGQAVRVACKMAGANCSIAASQTEALSTNIPAFQ